MATLMETGARRIEAPQGAIAEHLQEAEPESVAEAVAAHRAARERYADGLPAERQSYDRLRRETRSQIRAAYLSRVGRRIDLVGLLRQRTEGRRPIWTVANPQFEIGSSNGAVESGGEVCVKTPRGQGVRRIETRRRTHQDRDFVPAGMPALPPRVRELASDPKVRRRAEWIGVLYQPEEWHEVDPDPALVVEWEDRPGEYYALAVWGGDQAQIFEFVD